MNPEHILEEMNLEQKARLITGADFWTTASIEELEIPSLRMADGPAGLRMQKQNNDSLGMNRSEPATCFPSPSALAASWNPLLAFETGRALGQEARKLDVDVLLSPGINLIENPLGGRNFEFYSEDPFLCARMAEAMVLGIQEYTGACVKHFMVNVREKYRQSANEILSEETLQALYAPAFQDVIENANPDWVMSAYSRMNGVFSSHSTNLLTDTLRNCWKFSGAVVSDWGGCVDPVRSLEAGMNLEMPSTFYQTPDEIVDAVKSGRLSESVLDERVLELLFAVEKAQKRKEKAADQNDAMLWDFEGHHRLAVRAAEQCMVLLKNDGILPLNIEQKVLFVGPFKEGYPEQGYGSARVEPAMQVSFEKLLKKYAPNGMWVQGYDLPAGEKPNRMLRQQAIEEAEQAEIIVFLSSLGAQDNMEGLDRGSRHLPVVERSLASALLRLNKPVVWVSTQSSPIDFSCAGNASAILHAGLAGQGGREAMLRILYHYAEPCGALAQTIAEDWRDHPSSARFVSISLENCHDEGQLVGYRYFSSRNVPVRYPFGYGLSYGNFEIQDARVEEEGLRAVVTNESPHPAIHPVQLYVRHEGDESVWQLKGFVRVLLEAYERKEILLPFDEQTFMLYHPQTGQMEAAAGKFFVRAAMDAQDDRFEMVIERTEGFHPEKQSDDGEKMNTESCEGSTLAPLCRPVETFVDTAPFWVSQLIRRMQKVRDDSLRRNTPNAFVIALLDMSPNTMARMYGQYLSVEMAQTIANWLNDPKHHSLSPLPGQLKDHLRRLRHWKKETAGDEEAGGQQNFE